MVDEVVDAVARERIGSVSKEVGVIREDFDKFWTAIDEIRKNLLHRLPPWVTAVISVQMAMIGGMAMWILDHLGK